MKAKEERTKYFAFALIIALAIAGMGVFSLYYSQAPRTYSSSQAQYSQSGQNYMNVPNTYSDFGYPKITYETSHPYSASKPNFTIEYQTKNANFQLGYVENASVIGLNRAVELAVGRLNLTAQLQLAYADFSPGNIVNSTLAIHPTWYLFFAQAYDGFWTFGSYGAGAFSMEADIDALTGKPPAGSGGMSMLSLANSGPYELDVNSTSALRTLRAGGASVSGVPAALTQNGTVSFIEPRIVLLGPTSNNAAFQHPLDASLSGQLRLCWVIQLDSPRPEYGYHGTFAVDAHTGKLVSGWAENLLPVTHLNTVWASLNFASAKNLTISQETFQLDGNLIGRSGRVPVVVPNVLTVKPGSSSTIDLNFTSTFTDRTMIMSPLTFSNPLPGSQELSANALPAGVTVRFLTPNTVVPANGTGMATISISADKGAPSGTYLLKLDAGWSSPAGAKSAVIFLLTIANNTSQWPTPPIVK